MTSAQKEVCNRFACQEGAIHVREGYLDRHIEITVRRGACWSVDEDGHVRELRPDHSIDWQL